MSTTICPRMASDGSCSDLWCRYLHAVLTCHPCHFTCTSSVAMNAHARTKAHLKKIRGKSQAFQCPICHVSNWGRSWWRDHLASRRHRNKAKETGVYPETTVPEALESVSEHTFCVACNGHIGNKLWGKHLSSAEHVRNQRLAVFRVVLDDAERDKHGVTLAADFDFGFVRLSDASTGKLIQGTISTNTSSSRIGLVGMDLTSTKGTATIPGRPAFVLPVLDARRTITSASSLTFKVMLRQSYEGRCQDRIELSFEDVQLGTRFVITRPLAGIVGDKEDHEKLKPTAPYVPKQKGKRRPETAIVGGVRPPALGAVRYVTRLPLSPIPARLRSILSTGTVPEMLSEVKNVFLPTTFDSSTYARHLKHVLWIEEFKAERDLEIYDLSGVKLTAYQKYYNLQVPGLAEKRPSVLVGDRILVQQEGGPEGHWFEGGVHIVRKEDVSLRFDPSFKGWTSNQRYNVRFKLNRHPFRRQHKAINSPFSDERVLFPTNLDVPSGPYPRQAGVRLQVVNPLIATNAPQLQAVISIVRQRPRSPPFVIFGPPGTGKTVTMVEAIKQILSANPASKVLACTPSNSAADLLALRLKDLGVDCVFRYYAPSRVREAVPPELMAYTHVNGTGHFSVPPMTRMASFRVVISTCISASVASGIGLRRGHFSHIFIDEAGQATEPEVMIPIKTMADGSTNVVLSGDPKQLGPVIRSRIASQLGLDVSYIERLMKRDVYDIRSGYGITVVKLVKNFRSHGAILRFPNERFYDGELEQCGDKKIVESYLCSSYLPNREFPVVFHGMCGKDNREAGSPSFFNVEEVLRVKAYVKSLRADRRFRTSDSDIGVITPYNAQCHKIRKALRGMADNIKVGSVEEFQGQERRVIIISTVRSSSEFIEYDLKHTLGFVANPRRFNVAITRAQALLIIIGDPTVLGLDPLWRSFLNYVHLNKGWTGSPITWDPKDPVDEAGGYDRRIREAAEQDMNDRMAALTLREV